MVSSPGSSPGSPRGAQEQEDRAPNGKNSSKNSSCQTETSRSRRAWFGWATSLASVQCTSELWQFFLKLAARLRLGANEDNTWQTLREFELLHRGLRKFKREADGVNGFDPFRGEHDTLLNVILVVWGGSEELVL